MSRRAVFMRERGLDHWDPKLVGGYLYDYIVELEEDLERTQKSDTERFNLIMERGVTIIELRRRIAEGFPCSVGISEDGINTLNFDNIEIAMDQGETKHFMLVEVEK